MVKGKAHSFGQKMQPKLWFFQFRTPLITEQNGGVEEAVAKGADSASKHSLSFGTFDMGLWLFCVLNLSDIKHFAAEQCFVKKLLLGGQHQQHKTRTKQSKIRKSENKNINKRVSSAGVAASRVSRKCVT